MSLSDEAKQVRSFIEKYSPDMVTRIHACRLRMCELFPRGFELVYDNYNALAIGVSPTVRASDVVLSIAAYPRWVTLFFLKGVKLADPDLLLQGTGNQVRRIRLTSPEHLGDAKVGRLIVEAMASTRAAFAAAPELTTIVKSVSAKQRPRCP